MPGCVLPGHLQGGLGGGAGGLGGLGGFSGGLGGREGGLGGGGGLGARGKRGGGRGGGGRAHPPSSQALVACASVYYRSDVCSAQGEQGYHI